MIQRRKPSDVAFDTFIHASVIFAAAITLYPFVYVLSMSVSDFDAMLTGKVFLWPIGLSLKSYELVFQNPDIWQSYYNTLWYVVVGTAINILLTVMAAYPLSKKTVKWRNIVMFFIVFTMFFQGGLIPTYLLVRDLGLYNTRWAIVLPTAIGTMKIVIMRQFFISLPDALEESAIIDGASPWVILFRIMIPLSLPAIAAITLFYAVGHWNQFFQALIYLPDASKHPIQIYLRRVLIVQSQDLLDDMEDESARATIGMQMKYSLIIITILPIVCLYPFLQKYFIKGVMIGAIKQ